MGYNRQQIQMKKLFMISLALFGFLFMANAQTGECKIDNIPGAYIHATADKSGCDCGLSVGNRITVKVTVYGVDEKFEGAVTCVVTYVDKNGKEHETEPFSISYKNKRGQASADCICDHPGGIRVKKIYIENSWCSAR